MNEDNGWKVVGDPIPHAEIHLLGLIDVTAYYRASTDAAPFIVAGNYIGTDASGTSALGNRRDGILLRGFNSRVGTNGDGISDDAERNIISGNRASGIAVLDFTSGQNTIAGNGIGVGANGQDLGNLEGIHIDGARDNLIFANTIGSNETNGVTIIDGVGNEISDNSFSANALWASTWVATA